MKIRAVACISIAVGLLTFCGCGKQQEVPSSSSLGQTNATVSSVESSAMEADTKTDLKGEEAKKVINDYLNALASNDNTQADNFCTEHLKGPYKVKIDSMNVIKIADDEGEKTKSNYLKGRGSVTKPYDAICFSVTYDIQYNKEDEKKATEPSGEKTKWFTVVKMTKESPWKIDEIGY